MVSAYRQQALPRRDHRTDSREPARASFADRTAESGTCSTSLYFASHVDARPGTSRAPECPCTHVAIARLPRTNYRSLENSEAVRTRGRFGHARDCCDLFVFYTEAQPAALRRDEYFQHSAKE